MLFNFSYLCMHHVQKYRLNLCNIIHLRCNTNTVTSLLKNEIEPNLKMDKGCAPPSVRGMKILDRRMFSKTISVPWLVINEDRLGPILKYLKKYLLKLENFKPVQAVNSDLQTEYSGCTSNKKIILNPTVVTCYEDIEENDRNQLYSFNISKESLKYEELDLTYDNWRADELLKAILPLEKDSLTSYSIIGHIVHVNLRDHLLEYKQIIGQILLDKVKGAKTVVNKTDIIENTYRNFKMEILCGDDNMLAQVRENHCSFEFDFSSVYWNPRLCTEHERIVNKMKQGDVLYDVFAGVGPFAIPAAKKKCFVLANDLNPESHKWLQHNGDLNKVKKLLKTFNKDGRDFIKEDMRNDMLQRWKDSAFKNSTMHITMNLPAMAVTFLNTFQGLFTSEEIDSLEIQKFPVVHLYCFAKGDNSVIIAREMVEEHLGTELKDNLVEIHLVRNVSVKKEMMRVTFYLSKSILVAKELTLLGKTSRKECDLSSEFQAKRLCVEKIHQNH